jgi:hypothetical protein
MAKAIHFMGQGLGAGVAGAGGLAGSGVGMA